MIWWMTQVSNLLGCVWWQVCSTVSSVRGVIHKKGRNKMFYLNYRNRLPHGNLRPCMNLQPFSRLKTTLLVSVNHLILETALGLTWILKKKKCQVNKWSASHKAAAFLCISLDYCLSDFVPLSSDSIISRLVILCTIYMHWFQKSS